MDAVLLGLFLLAAAVVYFLPAIVATRRQHPNTTAITVLNLLLGWTLVGWVVSLVWACTSQQAKDAAANTYAVSSVGLIACPYCAEPIRAEAIKCKHCGADLTQAPTT